MFTLSAVKGLLDLLGQIGNSLCVLVDTEGQSAGTREGGNGTSSFDKPLLWKYRKIYKQCARRIEEY